MSFLSLRNLKAARKMLLFLIPLLIATMLFVVLEDPPPPPEPPPLVPNNDMLVGINYPWHSYGIDFGHSVWGHHGISVPGNYKTVVNDLKHLRANGATVVRWFLFADGRAGIRFAEDGSVKGLDEKVLLDINAAVTAAKAADIRILFVVVDFGFFGPEALIAGNRAGGHRSIAEDAAKRQTFMQNALLPVLLKFGQEPAIAGWDIVNEPEWEINLTNRFGDRKKILLSKMQDFVREAVDLVHKHTKHQATLGSAKRSWLRFWTGVGLDVYQFHYYPYMERGNPIDYPADKLNLDKPVILGEFPSMGSNRSVLDYMRLAEKNGYAGTLAWAYRSQDKYTHSTQAVQGIRTWANQHKHAAPQQPQSQPQPAPEPSQPGESSTPSSQPSAAKQD